MRLTFLSEVTMRAIRRILMAASGLLVACGGSGGGSAGGLDASVFSGRYSSVRLYASGINSTWDAGGNCNQGTWIPNGAGAATISDDLVNDNGAVFPVIGTFPSTYAVSGSGLLASTIFGKTWLGGVPSEGDVFTLATMSSAQQPALTIGLRSDGVFDNTSLTGTYSFVLLRYSATASDTVTVGDMNCDGLGGFTLSASTRNSNGTVVAFPSPIPGTYAVAPNGFVDLGATAGNGWRGGVLAGGRLAVLGGTTNAGGHPELLLIVRRDVGPASNLLFSGAYHFVAVTLDSPNFPGPPTPYTQVAMLSGDAVADGTGTVQLDGTANVEGAIGPFSQSFNYLVGANGAMTASPSAGAPLCRGAITSDGRFAAVGGGTVNGQSPTLLFFVRK